MMKKLLLVLSFAALAQATDTTLAYVPSSNTTVTTAAVRVYTVFLANVTAGAVTVTIKDRTTNCNGAACQVWPAVSIAANTVYIADMKGVAMTGIDWSASSGNSVVGQLSYGNQ